MPKAKPSPDSGPDTENDKTTLESGWEEEEASTTVEQNEKVAEKIRALGVEPAPRSPPQATTNVTSTGASQISQVDELTVDDGRVSPVLLSPIGIPASNVGRLVITQGNESGQELELLPSKSYTIGRGIDNDVVLTDIAVSRKHFDLRNDGGAWVLVDRGSGNGTVVNGNIEDHAFMLANGDVIEIGNTSFRFEQNGPPRAQNFEADDDEELSTVAGKPSRNEPAPVAQEAYVRPKTLPPPAPLPPIRTRDPSAQPYNAGRSQSAPMAQTLAPQPASTLPLPQQISGRGPILAPQAPTLLGEMPTPAQKWNEQPNLGGVMPMTIPGQMPQPGGGQRPLFYPQASEMSPQSVGVHAHMLVMPQQQRGDGSTVHVPPTPFNGLPAAQPARYLQPQLSRRTKYVLGGAALTLFAAITTVAIMKSGSKPKSAGAAPASTNNPSVEPIKTPDPIPTKPELKPAPKVDPPKVDVTKVDAVTPPNRIDPSKPQIATKTEPEPKSEPPKPEPPKTEPPKPEPPKTEPPKPTPVAKTEPPKTEPPKPTPVAKTEPPKPEPPKPTPIAKTEPPKPEPPKPEPPKTEPPKPTPVAKTEPPKPTPIAKTEPPKPAPKPAPPKPTKRNTTTATTASTPPEPKQPKPPRVATAAADPSEAKTKADDLYRNKKFSEAASVLYAAAKGLPEGDAKQVRYTASAYDKLGRAFSVGTAPATKPVEAYASLKQAESFDRAVGGAFIKDIETKLAQIAPKAAIGFMAAKDFEAAHVAVATAEGLGAANETTKVVKQTLDGHAAELYQQAKDDPASDSSKDKLRRILKMVDPKSVWYGKAQKLLSPG